MQTVEIRHSRKLLIPILVLTTLIIVASLACILLSDKYKNDNIGKAISIGGIILAIYFLFGSWQLIFKNKPALIFKEKQLEVFAKNTFMIFYWSDIIFWRIEKVDNNGYCLTLETSKCKEKISLNWLEKPPQEIERLIHLYSAKCKAQ